MTAGFDDGYPGGATPSHKGDDRTVIIDELRRTSGYFQLPDFVARTLDIETPGPGGDAFGVRDRWDVIRRFLESVTVGSIVDLGGHTGFLSVSALNAGLAQTARVYDVDSNALRAGEACAKLMGIEDRIQFVRNPVTLEFVERMPRVDCVFCLNLIHHAGSLFDVDHVASMGWEAYARRFVKALRGRSNVAVLGIGFKGRAKPPNWHAAYFDRPAEFRSMVLQSGWRIEYSANVADIGFPGRRLADGLRDRPLANRFMHRIDRWLAHVREDRTKKSRYHIYLLR